MKVADVMSKQVDFVTLETSIKDVCRLIFGRGINGVPVCKGKKVIGFVTERDILSKFYPSMQEYMEDTVHAGDFEAMEEKVSEILRLPISEIMSKNPTIITPDTPLLEAQSIMMVRKVGRLPVVDKKGNLVGILSKGDIFRAVVGEKLPFETDEKFHDWLSRRYDLIIDWEERLAKETPDFKRLFKKEKVRNILDVGCGTGMHVIALAKEGFHAVGIETSARMIYVANEKTNNLPASLRQNMRFIHHDYKNLEKTLLNEKFDAAIFMGSGLAHQLNPAKAVKEINKYLNPKAIIVCQVSNFEKILKEKRRLFDFNVRKSPFAEEREQAFLRFYDPVEDGFLTQNVSVFARETKKWAFRGMHSVSISYLNKNKISRILQGIGFSKIFFYGGENGFYYDYLFRKPFNIRQSDVLVVLAKRQR